MRFFWGKKGAMRCDFAYDAIAIPALSYNQFEILYIEFRFKKL